MSTAKFWTWMYLMPWSAQAGRCERRCLAGINNGHRVWMVRRRVTWRKCWYHRHWREVIGFILTRTYIIGMVWYVVSSAAARRGSWSPSLGHVDQESLLNSLPTGEIGIKSTADGFFGT